VQKSPYIFKDVQDQREYERLQKIEELFDPRTQTLLKRIGLRQDMSFLELGPGAGGLLGWVVEAVGSTGKITAIDRDTRYIDKLKHPNLQIINSDLTEIKLGDEQYDFIHGRYILMHIQDFQDVLQKIMAALKPGGWILLEEADFKVAHIETSSADRKRAFTATSQAINRLFSSKNIDHAFGKHLREIIVGCGFANIQEETYAPLEQGGTGTAEIMRLSALQLRDQYLKTGAVSDSDLREYVELASDPDQMAVYYATVSVWAQKKIMFHA